MLVYQWCLVAQHAVVGAGVAGELVGAWLGAPNAVTLAGAVALAALQAGEAWSYQAKVSCEEWVRYRPPSPECAV